MGQAYGIDPSNIYNAYPFSTALAYETYALDYDYNTGEYYSYLNQGDVAMDRRYTKTGGVSEFYYNYSRNRLNKLYWGFSVNLRSYKYEQAYTHTEMLTLTDATPFRGFEYQYKLKTSGTGLNVKGGFVYLATPSLRFGASFATPTFLNLKDTWSADATTFFADSTKVVDPQYKPEGTYKYRMTTPLRVTGSVSYQIGMRATINADLDYVAYSGAKLKGTKDVMYSSYDFASENQTIKERMNHTVNLRIGAEYNIDQKFFVRAGFNMYGPAYKKSENIDATPDLGYSGGLGYKKNNISIDFAYVNRQINRTNFLFSGSNIADTKLSANQVVFTFNVHF